MTTDYEDIWAANLRLPYVWPITRKEYEKWLIDNAEGMAKRLGWKKWCKRPVIAIPAWPKGVQMPPIFGGITATPRALQALSKGHRDGVFASLENALVLAKGEEPFWPALLVPPPVKFIEDAA